MRLFALLVACSLWACKVEPPAPTWHQDVRPLLEAHCTGCHQEGGVAPFALTDFAQVRDLRDVVVDAVTSGRMPPWPAEPRCAPYLDDPRPSPEGVDTLVRWAAAGAPEGDARHPAAAAPPSGPGLSRVDSTLTIAQPYAPPAGRDTYRCFTLDWPQRDVRYVTGFRARPGNAALVHHVIVFVLAPDQAADVVRLDAEDPEPGYSCFGGPGGSGYPNWLGVWAPGGIERDFPEGTGVPVQPGSKLVMQVHYAPHQLPGATDQSSIELALAQSVPRKAALLPMVDPGWFTGGRGLTVPAGAAATYSVDLDPTLHVGWVSQGVLAADKPLLVHAVGLHMHELGSRGSVSLRRSTGERECMLIIPRWDFHWQRGYFFADPKRLEPGDRLTLSCTFDNTAAHQPLVDGVRRAPVDAAWGEGTEDEMCVGVFYFSEP